MAKFTRTSVRKIADALAAFQDHLVDGSTTPDVSTDLDVRELRRFRNLQGCLFQLENLRRFEDSITHVDGPPFQSLELSALGATILGRFEVVREIGRGGLGIVFLARDGLLNRDVAIKVPRPEVVITPDVHRRFEREAQAAARLTHPHLIGVHEVGHAGPVMFIVSAYCPGPSLAAWLKDRGGRVGPRQAAHLLALLADAAHYAHSQGVLHRDIKPSNVFFEPGPEALDRSADQNEDELPFVPKLGDFGLAKLTDAIGDNTRSGVALGTLGYMSPEQAEGRLREIGPATDVYGLGAVLYECLTGRAPFVGTSEPDLSASNRGR